MAALAPGWMEGCRLRPCWFEPTFHKHVGHSAPACRSTSKPPHTCTSAFARGGSWRSPSRPLRTLRPEYPLWRDFPYEYEHDRLAIDVINGSPLLREWVDDRAATPADLDALATADEAQWRAECEAVLLYR